MRREFIFGLIVGIASGLVVEFLKPLIRDRAESFATTVKTAPNPARHWFL